MRKVPIDHAECEVEMDWYLRGSVLRGTVNSGCEQVRTRFTVESATASREEVIQVIRLAKQGCYAENLVRAAVALDSSIVLNGEDVAWDGPPESTI